MSLKALTNLQAANDLTLRNWNKTKSYKQKMKDRTWAWEETILKLIIKHKLFNNNMLNKQMIRTTSLLIKYLHLVEVILLTILIRKLILHPILIYNNPVLYKNSMRKIHHLMLVWISNQTLLPDWTILS